MYEEYDEYFDEPGVVDGIVDAAMMQMHDHLKAEIRHYLADVVSAENRKKNLENEIRRNENRLKNIESRIKEALEKEIDVEKREMPKRYIDAFIRNEIGDYAPGDTTWVINTEYKYEACPTCNEQKRIEVNFEGKPMEIECPVCKGYGRVQRSNRKAVQRRIKEVRLKLCFNGTSRVARWSGDTLFLDNDPLYDAPFNKDSLFPTKEAAEARIRELEQEGK